MLLYLSRSLWTGEFPCLRIPLIPQFSNVFGSACPDIVPGSLPTGGLNRRQQRVPLFPRAKVFGERGVKTELTIPQMILCSCVLPARNLSSTIELPRTRISQ